MISLCISRTVQDPGTKEKRKVEDELETQGCFISNTFNLNES